MLVESWAVRVPRRRAEEARRILVAGGLLVPHLRPRQEGDWILFPVRDPGRARALLEASGIQAEALTALFEARRRGPGRLEGPVKGYVVIGDIALFSRARGIPVEAYAEAAEALLEAQPRIRAAWLKTETRGEERVPRLVHLAGERRTRTIAREYGIPLVIDIAQAYYNPRLAGEHRRIAELVGEGEAVLDMFAGVGGFTLHIAVLRRALVVANDLNPNALDLAGESLKMNRGRLKGRVLLLQGDAGVLDDIVRPVFTRVILNLPSKSASYASTACKLVSSRAVHHYYVKARDCGEAVGMVSARLREAGCTPLDTGCRRALEYSPRLSIYAVDAVVER